MTVSKSKLAVALLGVAICTGTSDLARAEMSETGKAAMTKAAGIVWTEESLRAWIAINDGFMPGTRKHHVGLPQPDQRAAVISYLASLSGNR